jgi:DtxR family Mn-dependent transcriptional regulator
MQVNPLLALGIASALVVAAFWLFWPVSGLYWRWSRFRRFSDRTLVEDALKHLYDCEARRHPGTVHSLSGALGISGHRLAEVVARLEQLKLAESEGGVYTLTTEGRTYALRIIRVHRLWESYLSDDTGFDASEWHLQAEHREHTTTEEEAEALSARMGHPRFDPHGDPIPTSSGEIVPPPGQPLSDLRPGQVGRIVHLEDEPQEIYAQLLAESLYPGMQVRIFEVSAERIRFEAEGEEHVLAPVVAANLSVQTLPEEEEVEEVFERLSALDPGERATVVGLSSACRGAERRRFLDLGIIPGTEVVAELRSAGGDPTAYRIRGAVIALRRDQAEFIHVVRPEGKAA